MPSSPSWSPNPQMIEAPTERACSPSWAESRGVAVEDVPGKRTISPSVTGFVFFRQTDGGRLMENEIASRAADRREKTAPERSGSPSRSGFQELKGKVGGARSSEPHLRPDLQQRAVGVALFLIVTLSSIWSVQSLKSRASRQAGALGSAPILERRAFSPEGARSMGMGRPAAEKAKLARVLFRKRPWRARKIEGGGSRGFCRRSLGPTQGRDQRRGFFDIQVKPRLDQTGGSICFRVRGPPKKPVQTEDSLD